MWKFVCRWIGHKGETGPLKRSPYTSYTHYRVVCCARCGETLEFRNEWHDAITEPELFRS